MSGAALIRADALRLPLADESVDLVITSPPFWALRSYSDAGEHYPGQLGSEPHWRDFLFALWAATAEMARVLKPGGSIFVNLGDKYGRSGGVDRKERGSRNGDPGGRAATRLPQRAPDDIPEKSLLLLPELYRAGCTGALAALGGPDPGLNLIARAVIVQNKLNGLPESVTDRVRRSHEDWVHLTKEPRYYSAVDEIRETKWTGDSGSCPKCGSAPTAVSGKKAQPRPATASSGSTAEQSSFIEWPTNSSLGQSLTAPSSTTSAATDGASTSATLSPSPTGRTSSAATPSPQPTSPRPTAATATRSTNGTPTGPQTEAGCAVCACGQRTDGSTGANALGSLPGSVWSLPSEPLIIPEATKRALNLPDHYAAFGTEVVRRLILGWSPPGICTECGHGRVPVVDKQYRLTQRTNNSGKWESSPGPGVSGYGHLTAAAGGRAASEATILGYACPCTPSTRHPGTGEGSGEGYNRTDRGLSDGGYPDAGTNGNGRGHTSLQNRPKVGPWTEWHLEGWKAPPTRPAVILDPFVGSGTTVLVAKALGRFGVGLDLSADYLRLARWRIWDSQAASKAISRTNLERQGALL